VSPCSLVYTCLRFGRTCRFYLHHFHLEDGGKNCPWVMESAYQVSSCFLIVSMSSPVRTTNPNSKRVLSVRFCFVSTCIIRNDIKEKFLIKTKVCDTLLTLWRTVLSVPLPTKLAKTQQRYALISCTDFHPSSRSLSYDRSIASCKATSPHSAIWCFLFELAISSRFIKAIQ
jgi:hypothetical protein